MRNRWVVLFLFIFLSAIAWIWFVHPEWVSLDGLKHHQTALSDSYRQHPVITLTLYFIGMIAVSNLPFVPFAGLLGVAGGAIFGKWAGVPIIAITHTLGASIAFLLSRHLLREWFESHFASTHAFVQKTLKEHGKSCLFFFRLCPVVPSSLINLSMGLSPLSYWTFVFVSLLGMLPGSFLYARAGAQLAQIQSLQEIFTWDIVLTFAGIGMLPFVVMQILRRFYWKGESPNAGSR
ncbi:MAG: TVP38/TMEM64 family protein [Methylotenera sp.]|nr:TVP38/TMEM64 family protein [Oligoflexia bacterium]